MHTWQWHTWQGLSYLTCSLLDPFPHGFFTQQFWSRTPEDLVEILHPTAAVFRVKQVHGDVVLAASDMENFVAEDTFNPEESPQRPAADGVLSNQAQQAVWVCSADCVPALIADKKTGHVAAVHAGWRGTSAEIVPKAIARLQAQGSEVSDLRVVLGPAIAGEVYQVSTTVAAEVGATVVKDVAEVNGHVKNPDIVIEALRQLPHSPILNDPEPGRARLDVRRVNALQLEQLGLRAEQVAIAPYCTYQHADHFFSYRRDRLKKVQWSGIVSVHPTP